MKSGIEASQKQHFWREVTTVVNSIAVNNHRPPRPQPQNRGDRVDWFNLNSVIRSSVDADLNISPHKAEFTRGFTNHPSAIRNTPIVYFDNKARFKLSLIQRN